MIEKTKTIDGQLFKVAMLDVETAEDCVFDLLRIAGPTLAGLFERIEGKGLASLVNLNIDGKMLGSIIREAATIDREAYRRVSKTLASVSSVSMDKGKTWPSLEEVQAALFMNKLPMKWKWLAFALEVNFGGFLSGISSAAERAKSLVKDLSASNSPPASDGASGES